jgi:hypothetical protein
MLAKGVHRRGMVGRCRFGALLACVDIYAWDAAPEMRLLVFLEGVIADEVVADATLPALGVDGEVVEGILHLDPLVDLLEGQAVGRSSQDLVDQHAVVLGRLLQLFLCIVVPVQLQGRRLGLLPSPLLDGLLDIRDLALLAVLGLSGLVLALLGPVGCILRERVLPRPADLPLDGRLTRRRLRHVFLGELHRCLLPQPLLSLGHDAVLWRAARAAFLGYYGLQAGEQLERHFGLDGGLHVGILILLDGLHDVLFWGFFLFGLSNVIPRVREFAIAVILHSCGRNLLGACAASLVVVRAFKVKAHLLASLRIPSARHTVFIQTILGTRLAARHAIDDEDKVDIFDLQPVAAPEHDLLVLVVNIFTKETVLVQWDCLEHAFGLVELDL